MLFAENRGRSIGGAVFAAVAAFMFLGLIPNNLYSLNLTQTSIALVALGAVAFFVVTHHRTQGPFLNQNQEELSLLAAFGLFCLAAAIAYRSFTQRSGEHVMHESHHTHVEMGRVGYQPNATPLPHAAAPPPPPPPVAPPPQAHPYAPPPIGQAAVHRDPKVYGGYQGGYHDGYRHAQPQRGYEYRGYGYDRYVYY